VGIWTAVLLTLLTSVLGALLLRLAGRAHLRRFRNSLGEQMEFTADAAGRGIFMVFAGILLLVPGFLTDAVGLLLLLPATRRGIGRFINRTIARASAQGGPATIDLDPDEWRRNSDRTPPDAPPRPLSDRRGK